MAFNVDMAIVDIGNMIDKLRLNQSIEANQTALDEADNILASLYSLASLEDEKDSLLLQLKEKAYANELAAKELERWRLYVMKLGHNPMTRRV